MLRPALLLIDFFHPRNYQGMGKVGPHAVLAAQHTSLLRATAKRRGIPVIYINDNFGDWASNFSRLVSTCTALRTAAGTAARALQPEAEPFILKPRHSAFYGTPLEFLLEELKVNALALTGLLTDACITMTAHDAYVRKFPLWIPRNCVAGASAKITRTALDQLSRVTSASTVSSTQGWPRAAFAVRAKARGGRS
jgi:nicotinamidase-related amidase